jgi:hypothetical protein
MPVLTGFVILVVVSPVAHAFGRFALLSRRRVRDAACASGHRLTAVHRGRDYANRARVVALGPLGVTPG